jgi:hypothetical protein
MWDMLTSRLNMIRPLYNMEYSREAAKDYLKQEVNYETYDLHHGENLWTKFSNYVWMPEKFGLDLRKVFLSAQIRSGILTREQALKSMQTSIYGSPIGYHERDRLIKEVGKRFDQDNEQWYDRMIMINNNHHSFKTYETEFRQYKPIFWAMMKMGLVQETFYAKYCKTV